MSKKYKLRKNKRNPVTIVLIAIAIIAVVILMNTGYSLWQAKLNMNGSVVLENASTDLEVTLTPTDFGYTTPSGLTGAGGRTNFTFVSDKLEGNSLTTTLRASKNSGGGSSTKNLKVTFVMKNTSNNGDLYTNGSIANIETTNPSSAVSNVSTNLSSKNVSSGSTSTFTYSARVSLKKIKQTTTYKYEISFDVNGVTKYFYYNIVILPYNG